MKPLFDEDGGGVDICFLLGDVNWGTLEENFTNFQEHHNLDFSLGWEMTRFHPIRTSTFIGPGTCCSTSPHLKLWHISAVKAH